MKKSWMFLLLAPMMSLTAAYPIYEQNYAQDDAYDTNYDEVVASDSWDFENSQDDYYQEESLAYENDAQEEQIAAPTQKRSKPDSMSSRRSSEMREARAPSSRRAPAQASSRQESVSSQQTSPRSKAKEGRQNSHRPKVTQRGYESHNEYQAAEVEADYQYEEPAYERPKQTQRHQRNVSPRAKNSSQVAEKRNGQVQRRSSLSQRSAQTKAYKKAPKKSERRVRHHTGKRPLGE